MVMSTALPAEVIAHTLEEWAKRKAASARSVPRAEVGPSAGPSAGKARSERLRAAIAQQARPASTIKREREERRRRALAVLAAIEEEAADV